MKLIQNDHSLFSKVIIFLLLGTFAVASTFLVLLGARSYKITAENSKAHNEARILTSYARMTVRCEDKADSVRTETIDGIPVLEVVSTWDFETYIKYIYCYDGGMYELFTGADTAFEPENGERICSALKFEPVIEGQLLTIDLEDINGNAQTVYLALHTPQNAEEGLT